MTLQEWFDRYSEHHQNPLNQFIHWICVPSILFSLVGILSVVSFSFNSDLIPYYLEEQLHAGSLLILFGLIFYSRLSMPMTVGMAIVSFIVLRGVTELHRMGVNVFQVNVFIFVMAWIGQFIGHKIEGAKPSFFEDLKFLLIGPAWLLSFIYKALGIRY